MKQLLLTLIAPLLALSCGLAGAQQSSGGSNLEAAGKLAAILRDTRTLSADVQQLTLDQDGREIQEFQARLVLSKPNHVYWEITSPYSEYLIADGERIWRFEPDLEQVTVEDFSEDLNRTPVLLLNGEADAIAESYTVSAADMDFGARQRFILTPKTPDSLFERLSFTFNGKALEEMQFQDSLGQKTSLNFSELEMNAEIDPGIFVFDMPEGMEIIDNTSGQ